MNETFWGVPWDVLHCAVCGGHLFDGEEINLGECVNCTQWGRSIATTMLNNPAIVARLARKESKRRRTTSTA